METTIHTHIYGKDALKNLRAIIGFLAYVNTRDVGSQFASITVTSAPDGEVLFIKNEFRGLEYIKNNIWERGHAGFMKWISYYLKKEVLRKTSRHVWKKPEPNSSVRFIWRDTLSHCEESSYMPVTTIKVYYDALLRHRLDKHGKELVDILVGKPLDPISTELEAAKRDEIALIVSKKTFALDAKRKACNAKKDALRKETWNKLEAMSQECEAECQKISSSYDNEIQKVNERYEKILKVT